MKIENLRDKMLASHSDATTQEIECLETYHDEADKYGYFDTYYKVWSTEKIEKLESQNKKLRESNDKLREALRFYASRENWFPVPNIQGLELIVDHSDEELIKLGENESVYSGGKLARAVLKEVGAMNTQTDNTKEY